jgi:hypothetical protein
MADFLGADGRLDPSQDAIARRAHTSPRTVRTALACLARFGAVAWVRRLIRIGDRAAQTSNAYRLTSPVLSDGNCCRESGKKVLSTTSSPAARAVKNAVKGIVAALTAPSDARATLETIRARRAKALGLRA